MQEFLEGQDPGAAHTSGGGEYVCDLGCIVGDRRGFEVTRGLHARHDRGEDVHELGGSPVDIVVEKG